MNADKIVGRGSVRHTSGRTLLCACLYLSLLVLFSACSTQYNLQGNTSLSALEGQTLNLQSIYDDAPTTIASSRVTHGSFDFMGTIDSTIVAMVPLPEGTSLPVVLELGDIQITIDNQSYVVTGSPMNDALYQFFRENDEMDEQLYQMGAQLTQLEQLSQIAQMQTGHFVESDLVRDARRQSGRLYEQREQMIRDFIVANSDNVVGQYVFLASLRDCHFPLSRTCVEDILKHVKPAFAQNPRIACFLRDNNLKVK